MDKDNPFELDPVDCSTAVVDGWRTIILDAIEDDWSSLCRDPRLVADRLAERLASLGAASYTTEEIAGYPWASR